MNTPSYKQPPIVHAWVGHAVGTGLLGFMLPSGEHLGWLHRLVIPVVELIPNAVRLTNRSVDPILAQTFIGLSLAIAFLILLYFKIAVKDYRTKVFDSKLRRYTAILFGWVIFIVVFVGVFWFIPYMDPASKGKAYFLVKGATSGTPGMVLIMNQLIVGFPLFMFLLLWVGHECTEVRQ